ncbi:WD40 repeat domain-containing protein [Gloeocapsa sp. PCC 73106]|uniref:WD40 repeat domain-containing protein n=1 Tax=Gloeocapsa sp. PCC 73106 TaxID=102232 RepID=UPI0002ACC700|nr:WD40 repeat domain-containing protein [Gloeocapsa sp. PCC 73106]ELR99947.1 WD40 repeat-containing protein [Gloeocapsa sp. PCC 73106]
MNFFRLNGLDLAEYLVLLLSLVGLVIYLIFNQLSWFLVFIFLALVLNLINRLLYQSKTQKKLAYSLKKLAEELNTKEKLNTNIKEINYQEADYEQITNIKQAIETVINYLDQNQLDKRIVRLENLLNQKSQKTRLETVLITENCPSLSLSWELIKTIPAHSEAVTSLTINQQQEFLASVSWDKHLKVWNLANGELIDDIEAHTQGILAVSYADSLIATGGFDQEIKIWSITKELRLREEQTLTAHSGSIHSLAIALQNKILISASYDQSLKQWDLETRKKIVSSLDELGAIYTLAVHEESQIIASGGGDGTVTLWKLNTGEQIRILTGNISSVQSLGISPDGQIIAAGCTDGSIKLWTKEIQEPMRTIRAHAGQVMSLVFHPQGILFSGGAEGKIKVWETSGDQALFILPDQGDRVLSLALSQNGNLLASGTLDGVIKIWSLTLAVTNV